tara:strand:- start:539 stop:1213 length:675 start_codon:yes stop_codon:yes gene_type:complete
MKIAISGASGKTGFRVAEEAIRKGHSVHLLIRKTSIIPESLENCKKTVLSLNSQTDLDQALSGEDALVIATGARPSVDLTGPAKIDALGVKAQVESCKRVGVNRVVLVSSLCAGKWLHPLNLFGLILIWKRIGENSLINSPLNWTIIRPGGLNENEKDLEKEEIYYSAEGTQEEGSIPRRLVARCCIESLKSITAIGKVIEITSNQNQKKISLDNAIRDFEVKA